MTRDDAAELLYQHIMNSDFNAPYGVLINDGASKTGKKCKIITFGRARTLDATLSIYSPKFIHLRTSSGRSELFRTVDAVKDELARLYR